MSISLTRILQQITGINTFLAGPSASRDNGVVLLDSATVAWSTDGQGNIIGTAAGGTLPTATAAGQVLTATGPGTTYAAQTPVAPGMVLIQNQTLSSSAASVVFSAIPQTFQHLKLVISLNSGEAGTATLVMEFNGDANAAHYTTLQSSGFTTSAPWAGVASAGACVNDITIPGYGNANLLKRSIGVGYDGGAGLLTTGMSWSTTSAITSITLATANAANMLTGSSFSLYGLN